MGNIKLNIGHGFGYTSTASFVDFLEQEEILLAQ